MPIENEMSVEEYTKALKKAEREKWERVFAKQLDALEWEYLRQYKFHPDRNWSFDFVILSSDISGMMADKYTEKELRERAKDICFRDWFVLVDIQGGIWSGGAHVRGGGYTNDIEKMNAATALGWDVYWFTSDMVEDGSAIQFLIDEVWK